MARSPLAYEVIQTSLVDGLTNVLSFIVAALAKCVNLFYKDTSSVKLMVLRT